MDDPALRRALGLVGHASNLACPLCRFQSKPEKGAEQSFHFTGDLPALRSLLYTQADIAHRLPYFCAVMHAHIVAEYDKFKARANRDDATKAVLHEVAVQNGRRFVIPLTARCDVVRWSVLCCLRVNFEMAIAIDTLHLIYLGVVKHQISLTLLSMTTANYAVFFERIQHFSVCSSL
jgi:hypothetical protein